MRTLLVAVVLALAGMPAAARIITVSYAGTVAYGHDLTGIFGAADADLDGLAYTAQYIFDDTRGTPYRLTGVTGVYGGSSIGTTSPAISLRVTINGATVAISPDSLGSLFGNNYGYYSATTQVVTDFYEDAFTYRNDGLRTFVERNDGLFPRSYGRSFTHVVDAADSVHSYLQILHTDLVANVETEDTYASLSPEILTIASIPEPTTWALLIGGFGLIGIALRRQAHAPTT